MVRAEGAATRDGLVAAGRAHLDEHGLDGLTLRAIARRAGVSHGAPLRHFPGVDHLLAAVATSAFRDLHRFVVEAADEAGDDATAVERLAAAARGYVRFALSHPGPFELMFRRERYAAEDAEVLTAGAEAFLQLVDLVAAAQTEEWRSDEVTGELAAVLWASIHGVASLWLPGTMRSAVSLTGAEPMLDDLVDGLLRVLDLPPTPPTVRVRRKGRS